MTKHWRILGMSLLALIGVLAVGAPTAQAKWLILVELKPGEVSSVKELKLKGSREGGIILSEVGNKIRCTGAIGTGSATLSENEMELSGTATVSLTGCAEENFEEICTIHSVGQPNGTIVASGAGKFEMKNEFTTEEVWVKAESLEFTSIEYLGEECPLDGANEIVSGGLKITTLDALKLQKLHEIHSIAEKLKLGELRAELHMLESGTSEPLPLILGSIEEAAGRPFAFHLVNL